MPTNAEQASALRWQKFPVLDDGFVCLVDVMGDDQAVVQAARVSYGEGTRKVSDDRGLIRYLLRHRHTTPFEMVEIKFLVRVPMDCWRQWIRHRTANVNEYSTRYSLAIDATQTTAPDAWRLQAEQNRQGSGRPFRRRGGRPAEPRRRPPFQAAALAAVRRADRAGRCPRTSAQGPAAVDLYRSLLEGRSAQPAALSGAADGQPRAGRDPTVRVGDRRAALSGRCFPLVWEAFVDYRLEGLFLTRQDFASDHRATDEPASPPPVRAQARRKKIFWPSRIPPGRSWPVRVELRRMPRPSSSASSILKRRLR